MTTDEKAAEELETLAPELTIQVAGREVTISEPSWIQSLEWEGPLKPVIEDLAEAGKDDQRFIDTLLQLTASHQDVMLEFMAFCGGVDRAWLESLNDADGRAYMMAFWRVNRGFFGRRLSLARALAAGQDESAGAKSSQH